MVRHFWLGCESAVWKLFKMKTTVALLLLVTPLSRLAIAAEPMYQGEKFSRVLELRSPEATASAALELGIEKTLPILIRALDGRDTIFDQAKQEVWKDLPSNLKAQHLNKTPMPASSTRRKALMVLSEIGIEAGGAVPALITHLSAQTNRGDRISCLSALAAIGADSEEAVNELAKATQDADATIAGNAVMGLVFIGPKAAPAVPILVEQLRSEQAVSPWIVVALDRIGPAASNALPVLLDAFRHPSKAVSVPQALRALRNMGPAASPAIPELAKVIEQRGQDYPYAVEALLNIGPRARECLPLLESLLSDTNAIARVLAAAAVIRIGGDAEKSLPVLVRALEDADRSGASWSPPFSNPRGPSAGFNVKLTAA